MTMRRSLQMALPVLLLASTTLLAQGSAGTKGKAEPRYLIDMPTAGMLARGSVAVDLDFYQDGGILMGLSVGVFEGFAIGLSYGGTQLLGSGSPEMNPLPGVLVKGRVLDESTGFPALAIGFDSQGRDGYLDDLERYRVKSPGFFAVVSKNYLVAGYLSLHGGVNYSLEDGDGDRSINVYGGAEKTIGPYFSILGEYNAALNDNGGDAIGKGRGYLNLALKWSFAGGVTLGVYLKDLLGNSREGEGSVNRTARFEVVSTF
jgi:hypothetical protein